MDIVGSMFLPNLEDQNTNERARVIETVPYEAQITPMERALEDLRLIE
jgi:hypothetical protein